MDSPRKCQLLMVLLLIYFVPSTYTTHIPGKFSKLVTPHENNAATRASLKKDLKISFYHQTLDHFNYLPQSYVTFKQKYIMYSKHWGRARTNSPIIVYLGDESSLDDNELDELILPQYAARLKALLVFIEHRFYGDSVPFGLSMDEVMKNETIRGYFNSAQALADYAELILHLKGKLDAQYSPVIVVGGSYGGMLASWFRLKYPHVALGALAASAPVLYFDDIISPNNGYYSIVNKDYIKTSESCYETIKKSWAEIDHIGSKQNGLSFLSQKFNTCIPLKNTGELKYFLETLYDSQAQYGGTIKFCKAIDNKTNEGTNDILGRIYAGVIEYYGGIADDCIDPHAWDIGETPVGYAWQTCSEMVMPVVRGTPKESMFPPETWHLQDFIRKCKIKYNVLPRPHWITTYYGGHDMKLVLKRYASNIIFSNGLRDPYSSAGVLEDLSDSIIAVYSTNGSHCQDLYSASEDDPEWLIKQRERELEIIAGWLKRYYEDLKEYLRR